MTSIEKDKAEKLGKSSLLLLAPYNNHAAFDLWKCTYDITTGQILQFHPTTASELEKVDLLSSKYLLNKISH